MADAQPPAAPLEGEPLTINLQILVPSHATDSIRFDNMAASTTLGEIKAMIRDLIHSRPSNDQMRLLYQARFLSRDGETLRDVFGETAIRESDQQTLHLILRDGSVPAPAPVTDQTTRSRNPAPRRLFAQPSHPPNSEPQGGFPYHTNEPHPLSHNFAASTRAMQDALRQAYTNSAHPYQRSTVAATENMLRQQLQAREAARFAEGARLAEAEGHVGLVTHEHIEPDGTHVRITTFEAPPLPQRPNGFASSSQGNTPAPYHPGQLPNTAADILRATQTITNAMHRSASGASIASMASNLANTNRNGSMQPIQPGVTTPLFPGTSRNASRTGTPDPFTRSASQPQAQGQYLSEPQWEPRVPSQPQTDSQLRPRRRPRARRGLSSTAEVYIIHSPDGPHSLLVNHQSDLHDSLAARARGEIPEPQFTPQQTQGLGGLPAQGGVPPPFGGFQTPPGFMTGPPPYSARYPPVGYPASPAHQMWQPQARFQFQPAFQHGFQPFAGFQQPTFQTQVGPQSQAQYQRQLQAQAHNLQQVQHQLEQLLALTQTAQAGAVAAQPPAAAPVAPAPAPVPAAAAPAPVPNQAQVPPPAVHVMRHPGNPGAGALFAVLWPHIWLLIRLFAFAWWFSYSDPSWERWLSLAVAFVVVVVINTGILNGLVNDAFNPVRAQLEGLLPPLANAGGQDQQQQQEQQQPQQQEDNQQSQDGNQNNGQQDPDPAETARRLVAQRRVANGTWLRDQARWLERAGVLLLASLAPGVAERHIRQLEEREVRERVAAREAAAERARLAQEAEAAANQETENNQEGQLDEGHGVNGQEVPAVAPGLEQEHLPQQQQQQQPQQPVNVV